MSAYLEKVFMVIASMWGLFRIVAIRPQILVYGNDMLGDQMYEPRMAGVYEWLVKNKVPFAHIVHATPTGRVVRNWWRRHEPVVYLGALPSSLYVALMRVVRFRAVLAIDDYRFWPHVVDMARSAGAQSFLFQHGRFTRHQEYLKMAHAQLPTKYIVWNEYWKRKILALSPLFSKHQDAVLVGGKPSGSQGSPQRLVREQDGRLRVMVIHEPDMKRADVHHVIQALAIREEIRLFYKIRKDQSAEQQIAHHGLKSFLDTNSISVTTDVSPCDLVLGSYSTLLYEMVAMGIPVGVLQVGSTQADDLVEDGLATPVDPSSSAFMAQVQVAANVSDADLAMKSQVLAVSADIRRTLGDLLL